MNTTLGKLAEHLCGLGYVVASPVGCGQAPHAAEGERDESGAVEVGTGVLALRFAQSGPPRSVGLQPMLGVIALSGVQIEGNALVAIVHVVVAGRRPHTWVESLPGG